MGKDDAFYRRAFSRARFEVKQRDKKQGQSNANLGRQWGTNLSAQYDNDGNPPERPGTGGVKAPKKPKPKSPKDSAAAKVVQPTLF
jgi:hypothetical protein